MSYNDPFESEGTAGTVNFDAPAGSGRYDSSGFSSDSSDSGSPTFTRGKPGSRGGTQISGNTIYGGQIISDKTLGRSYDFESEDYQKYLDATGRSMQNPYGDTGLFSGIFGADKVYYNLDPTTAKNILDAGFDRYNDFLGQDSISQNRGFGKLFGGPEGEMTAQGEVRAQVPETTTAASLLSSIIPGASFLPTPGTTYAPMGSTSYDPERDPSANQDLRSGPFSLLTDALSKGREFISDRLNPLPDAPPSRPRAPVQETRRDIIDTRTPAPLTPEQEVAQMAMYEAEPLYPNMTNYGKRDPDSLPATLSAGDFIFSDSDPPLPPATLSAGDFVLPSGEVINTNRSSFSGSILKDIVDGNLFETDFLGGQLKFSPKFDLKRGFTGGNIQFKKRF
jgi:hypothetical protein